MRPPVILEPSTTFSPSYSSPTDRRLNTLARHLGEIPDQNQMASNISPSPTASSDSVFAHIVQAPEDPILGVTFLLLFLFDYRIAICLFFLIL